MAVRFDAATDRLLRTTSPPSYDANYSVCFWMYLVSALDQYEQQAAWSLDSAQYVYDALGLWCPTDAGVQYLLVTASGNDGQGATSISLATWYHVAMVRSAANARTGYLNGVSDATMTTSVSGRAATTRMEMGAFNAANDGPFDGRVFAVKVWTAALTAAEIQDEMRTILPKRTLNLHGFWPCFPGTPERLTDYSGNARVWTAGGTLTDEDPPPVSWGARSPIMRWTAAAVPPAAFVFKPKMNVLLRM